MIKSQLSKDEQGKTCKQTELRLRVRKELDGFKRSTVYCSWVSDKDDRGMR